MRHLIRVMRRHDMTKKDKDKDKDTLKEQSQGLVTFETLITMLTIENLDL